MTWLIADSTKHERGGEKGLSIMVVQQAETVSSSGSGVLLSGTVPPLADAYYPREQSGPDLASSLRPGKTVVLIHGEETEQPWPPRVARARPSWPWSSPTSCGTAGRWRS